MYRMLPQRYKKGVETLLVLSGSRRHPDNFFRTVLIISLLLGLGSAFISLDLAPWISIAVFAGVFSLLHGFLILAVDRRTKFVETILPDALQLVAANSRAGYIPSRALMLSARKEFGPLSDAIKKAGKDMLAGDSVDDALRKIPRMIKSEILEKTINLIIEGSKSGGHFATLLDENAEDIRRVQILQKEVKANVMMYIIFIGFAGAIAAPVLYSLSGFLINTIGNIGTSAVVPENVLSQVSFMQLGGVEISQEFLFWFSVAAIFITTTFGGILLGSMSTGNEKAGIKYIPIFMIVAFSIYFLSNSFIGNLFAALTPVG